jgi:hypothetical protein
VTTDTPHLQDHFVILGWSPRVLRIIKQLRNDEHAASGDLKPILVVLPDSAGNPTVHYERVYFLYGSIHDADVLRRSNLAQAAAVLIPAPETGGVQADPAGIFAFLSALSVSEHTRICLEVTSARHAEILTALQRKELLRSNVEIISLETVSESLMAQAAITGGVTRVIDELLAFDENTPEIYCCALGSPWLGKSYKYLRKDCAEHRITLLGYQHQSQLSLNPENLDYIFVEGDRVWFLALNRAVGLAYFETGKAGR